MLISMGNCNKVLKQKQNNTTTKHMEATIKFNLDDEDDIRRYEMMNAAPRLVLAIWEYDQKLRSLYKYEGKEEAYDYRNMLREMLIDKNVNHLI
jgi:hypothetical protein